MQLEENGDVVSAPIPVRLYKVRANRADSGSHNFVSFYFSDDDGLNRFQEKNDCLPHQEVDAIFEDGQYFLGAVPIQVDAAF